MPRLSLTYRDLPVYSLAAQQNAYPLFSNARLTYLEDEGSEKSPVLRDITVVLECEGGLLQSEKWEISQIAPGQFLSLQDRRIRLAHDYLSNLSDETDLKFTFSVFEAGNVSQPLLTQSEVLTVLPANFWGGESRQPELLAAFVKPNGVYVESLVKKVTEVLEANGKGRSADGYQSNTREKPYLMVSALWSVISGQKISYVSPPPSFAERGQLVRMASEISNNKMGACLDLSLLFASCLELMGLNTVIALTKGHAFVGVWLVDTMFPLLANDDPMELRKRVDASDLVFFETTMVTNVQAPTLLQASAHARSLISEDSEDEFVYAIDIAQARARKIRPLGTEEERPDEAGANTDGFISLAPVPPLPPVMADERKFDLTPETRIDAWQRKLLDLTKRNPLLSFKDRSAGIRLFCPDIGAMEDRLADNATFSFVAAEESPINDLERSAESFLLATGNDLHTEYAIDQLKKDRLIANMPRKKLDAALISLLRKAKNDLEEGGANTLFIALGMLSWQETPDANSPKLKAPLILIPVQLVRKSARAPVKLKQLQDEEPLFNLTLIEFLQSEHGVNLGHLREDLPEDESGLDVKLIWQHVREAISEQRGFEVVEESVIASFSFAKYLMWKDLRDRIGDLKKNAFVEHMVDRPQDAYQQEASFVLRDQIDEKIQPSDIFTPLNCDSSQLVAVEASSRPQDFVLEGPPGTGKSETIANMIANNLAKGRKVLFVAEKIAALQVVYRRLEKIGLDHFALELHSNKANKKAVLDQLRRSTEIRQEKTAEQWIHHANLLRDKRDELNSFVKALHQTSIYGISPREAIARVAGYGNGRVVNLDWGAHLSDCPFKNEDGLKEILAAAKMAGIAYGDVEEINAASFKLVSSVAWSFAWQSELVEALNKFMSVVDAYIARSREFSKNFNLSVDSPNLDEAGRLEALSRLTELSESQSIDFALGSDVLGRLDRLGKLASEKGNLDDRLKSIAHKASAPRLASTPVDEWIDIFEKAQQSWWKKFFVKGRLNKLARANGYEKFSELNILYALKEAKQTLIEVDRLSEEFQHHQIWTGWNSQPDELFSKQSIGREIHELIKRVVGLVDDPLDVLTAIKAKLVDGREFLGESKLIGAKIKFDEAASALRGSMDHLAKLSVGLELDLELKVNAQHVAEIVKNERKLKPWVEWVAAKNRCYELKIGALPDALEARSIIGDDAEGQLYTAFCDWLAPRLIDESDSLRGFKASEHNDRLKEFRKLDADVARTTSDYIASLLSQKTPDITAPENAATFRTLSHEFQKKTRHKPVRALFEELGARILDLTPCMMMSPLSVAQFLPSDFNAFDVVIFDEASQMTTWDSVGAIARGKNVIVVGDPKQMPPTNFFSSAVNPDDPDEDDLESILDQALAAGLPHLRLMGHYRSKHETLIAFSNSKYYENALVTYPSSDTKESAVVLHRVNGVYSKGKGRNNPIEAKAVVQEITKRILQAAQLSSEESREKWPTFGIVTLNTEQQRTIEDLLDVARRRYPEIEPYFQATDDYDPVFVKNLESVQGDERDIIIFSLGYGPTEPGGKTMSMNFGPLNKSGGERRLNVAITRATTEVIVFSSFDSSMIDLSRTSALAVEHLKHYLEFAEKGPIALAEQSSASYGVDQFDSDFEEAVAWALRDRGWKIQTQIGVSKFRVDLGVIHPDFPGVFLAGVECDGATYHGSPSARDRDRIRQDVLESLGWRLVRLWSTDYFRDPDEAIQKVHDRLNEILESDRARSVKEEERGDVAVDLDSPIEYPEPMEETDSFEEESTDTSIYKSDLYFDPSHEPVIRDLAKKILIEKPGITQNALALELGAFHGLSKTSKKQLGVLSKAVDSWAGRLLLDGHDTVYWATPGEIREVIPWRGLSPFGESRSWREIAYPEALGLALEAIKNQPDNPVDYICNAFGLKRRAEVTLAEFQKWVDEAAAKSI